MRTTGPSAARLSKDGGRDPYRVLEAATATVDELLAVLNRSEVVDAVGKMKCKRNRYCDQHGDQIFLAESLATRCRFR